MTVHRTNRKTGSLRSSSDSPAALTDALKKQRHRNGLQPRAGIIIADVLGDPRHAELENKAAWHMFDAQLPVAGQTANQN